MKIYLYADEMNVAAKTAKLLLKKQYPYAIAPLKSSDVIVSLGGDGTTLAALRLGLKYGKKVYGMNLGHLGAYQNRYQSEQLLDRLKGAVPFVLHPLKVRAIDLNDKIVSQMAWNEVYVRSGDNPQQARLIGSVKGDKNPFYVYGDGHLLATPMGSCAYNLSAGGHKLGFREKLLASTSIAACRGVDDILPATAHVHLETIESVKRPVSLFADNQYLGKIRSCDVYQDFSEGVTLLWDPEKLKQIEQLSDRITENRPVRICKSLVKKGYYRHQYQRS